MLFVRLSSDLNWGYWGQRSPTVFKKGIPQTLQIVTTFASSQLRLLWSYQQIYSLRRPSLLPSFEVLPEPKQWYSKKPTRWKAQLYHFYNIYIHIFSVIYIIPLWNEAEEYTKIFYRWAIDTKQVRQKDNSAQFIRELCNMTIVLVMCRMLKTVISQLLCVPRLNNLVATSETKASPLTINQNQSLVPARLVELVLQI